MSRAAKADFIIEQGATFTRTLTYKTKATNLPIDLTGWNARMKIKVKSVDVAVILSLTMGSGLTIPNPTDGKIYITITSVQTAAFDFNKAVYDLEIYDTSSPVVVKRLLKGKFTLDREVTV